MTKDAKALGPESVLKTVKDRQFSCRKCGHTWRPLATTSVPKICPKCKSKKYWLPKQYTKRKARSI